MSNKRYIVYDARTGLLSVRKNNPELKYGHSDFLFWEVLPLQNRNKAIQNLKEVIKELQ